MKNSTKFNRVSVVAMLLLFLSLATNAVLATKYVEINIRLAFAQEQIETFFSIASDQSIEADERTSYIREYYPTGTKQVEGTVLNRIVELCREAALGISGSGPQGSWE